MIRRGKTDGWLALTPDAFRIWADTNDVEFSVTRPGVIAGKGTALLANRVVEHCDESASNLPVLLKVPSPLILALEAVHAHAKVDRDFRERELETIKTFGAEHPVEITVPAIQVPVHLLMMLRRLVVLSSSSYSSKLRSPALVFQSQLESTDLSQSTSSYLSETSPCHQRDSYRVQKLKMPSYVKSLPLESLPTFWSQPEQQLLVGTTLAPALAFKLKSLHREYDSVCASTAHTKWQRVTQSQIDFEDWLQVDAMYRSRALEFPSIGHCMIPCLDLANHDPHEGTIAIYEKDADGNAVLLLRDGKQLVEGDEVTITYGDEKGACEMLFSYGFLEADRQSAETLFLDLSIPDDDTARSAKNAMADCAPGVKIIDAGDGEIDWTGEYIWLLCVNREDGLQFKIAQTVDGESEEIHAFFGEHALSNGAPGLLRLLGKHKLWDVYRLRAVAILQQRVLEQMQVLFSTQDEQSDAPHGDGTEVKERRFDQAMQLRRLEFELLERAYEYLEKQKFELAESTVVKEYLAAVNGDGIEQANTEVKGPQQQSNDADDFS
nr:set domain-containing protein 8 [Quercus suber]